MADSETGHLKSTSPLPPPETPQDPSKRKKKYWLYLSLGGCGLLLCVAMLIVGSIAAYNQTSNKKDVLANEGGRQPTAEITESNFTPIPKPTQAIETASTSQKPTASKISASATVSTDATPTIATPQFGTICFKPVVSDNQTLTCGTSFPPTVYEVHAIFDYTQMQPQEDTWTRIWYLNGQEVLKVVEPWNGDTDGQFDYNLNTSDEQPLSAGIWELELYANDVLLTYGAFTITASDLPTNTPVEPTAAPTPTPTPAPILAYKLAFTKWDGSKHSIWTADLDGSNQRFLLDFAASPSWSPDGRNIAFFGEEGIDTQEAVSSGTNGVWIMGAGGEQPMRLLPEGSAQTVTWSPAGDSIAFDAARGGPDRRIYFIDIGGNPQPFETLGEQPSYAPNGLQLAVKVCRPECGLWIENRDDSSPRQLTTAGSDGLPAWSPDGSKIAFSRNVDDNVDIYTINPDGSNLQRLTDAPGNDSVPTWTPDNRQLVFRTTRNGIWQIFSMNVDGSNQQLIIDNVGASNEWAFDHMTIK